MFSVLYIVPKTSNAPRFSMLLTFRSLINLNIRKSTGGTGGMRCDRFDLRRRREVTPYPPFPLPSYPPYPPLVLHTSVVTKLPT